MTLPYQNSASFPEADHETTEIGGGKYEYRGCFISKQNFERRYTVLKPAPSEDVLGRFPNIWDVVDAVDAWLDHGIEPQDEDEPRHVGKSLPGWQAMDRGDK